MHERLAAAALQRAVADRRMIARDQDPGPPEASEMRGLTFDQSRRSCASPSKEQPIKPFELSSSPEPPQKGDFPLPDESQAYA